MTPIIAPRCSKHGERILGTVCGSCMAAARGLPVLTREELRELDREREAERRLFREGRL